MTKIWLQGKTAVEAKPSVKWPIYGRDGWVERNINLPKDTITEASLQLLGLLGKKTMADL